MARPRAATARPLLLLGLGNVHRALLRILAAKREELAGRYGVAFEVAACGDRAGWIRGPDSPRSGVTAADLVAGKEAGTPLREVPGAKPVSFADALVHAGPRAILLDAASMKTRTGGAGLTAARRALKTGRSVVFANKSAVALAFDELADLAERRGGGFGWSATVCGALPIVNAGTRDLVAARFRRVRGVFNATSNLVLDRMAAGDTREAAVAEAQRRGIAETDPTNDLDGTDTAMKLAIIARTVLGQPASLDQVERAGIEAAPTPATGEVVRLLGEAAPAGDGGFALSVRPVAVPRDSFFGGIGSGDMALEWETDIYGTQRFSCTENDATPTAAAMLRDAVHIARGAPTGPTWRTPLR